MEIPPTMATKLHSYLNGLLEAIWLGALIIIPIFFNVYTSRIFEPDKIVILRSLALISLVILLMRLIEGIVNFKNSGLSKEDFLAKGKSLLRKPFVIPILGIVLSYFLATFFSVSAKVSFWGSYQRLQGTYTTLSYIIIFLSIIVILRRRSQLERLLTVAIMASLPVSLYGVIQRYGLDPIPWAGNVVDRVAANMGNSIFVAAYLIMVFPFTIIRIVRSIENIISQKEKNNYSIITLILYLCIASAQLASIYFSGSRGPWLGLGVSIFVLFLGITYVWGNRKILLGGLGIIILLGMGLIILNIPGGPFDAFKSIPRLGRLGQLLDLESRTGRVRTLIWEGTSELFLPHDPLQYPNGSLDKYNSLRPLIGYGPETMFVAFNRFYQPELTQVEKRNASPDRSHNETWDILIFSGITGLFFYLFLVGSISYYVFKWLRLIEEIKHKILFFILFSSGTIISTIILVLWKGFSFLGVGLPFGFLVGILAFLTYQSIWYQGKQEIRATRQRSLIFVAILAALLAHFTELIFGFGISSTKLYFWIYTGVLLVMGEFMMVQEFAEISSMETQPQAKSIGGKDDTQLNLSSKDQKRKQVRRKPVKNKKIITSEAPLSSWLPSSLTAVLLVTLLSVTIAFDFLAKKEGAGSNWEIIQSSFFIRNPSQGGGINGALIVLSVSWFLSSLLLSLEGETDTIVKRSRMFFTIAIISAVVSGIYIFIHSNQLLMIIKSKPNSLVEIMDQVRSFEGLFIFYFLFILLIIFSLGWGLAENWYESQSIRLRDILMPVGFSIVLLILIPINLRIVQADVAFKASETFTRPGFWPAAIDIYDRAISLAPNEDYYYLFVVRAYLEQARSSNNPDERESLMFRGLQNLERAVKINPLNTDHTANLARLYISWADFTEDPIVRQERLNKGVELYKTALGLSPNNSRLWGELALIYNTELNQPEESMQALNKGLELDPNYDWLNGLLGEFLFSQAEAISSNGSEKENLYIQSLDAYQRSLDLSNKNDAQNRFRIMLSLARVLTRLNRIAEAIEFYQKALNESPEMPENWRIHEILSSLYLNIDNRIEAIQHARQSFELAPDDQRARLEKWINELSGQP